MEHLALDARQLVDDFNHVDGNANRTSLICHGARDGLADPPRCVGRELEALCVVKLLNCSNQTEVAFLNEIEEEHAAAGVALRQRDDEAEVCFEEVVLRIATVTSDDLELSAVLAVLNLGGVEQVLGVQASLDALREFDLFGGIQKRDLADLLEVVLDRISGRAGDVNALSRLIGVIGILDDERALRFLVRRGHDDGLFAVFIVLVLILILGFIRALCRVGGIVEILVFIKILVEVNVLVLEILRIVRSRGSRVFVLIC